MSKTVNTNKYSNEQKAIQDLNSSNDLNSATGDKRIQSLSNDDSNEHESIEEASYQMVAKGKLKYKPEFAKENVILSVNHLKVFFEMGKFPRKFYLKAVHDTNFNIHKGEVFADRNQFALDIDYEYEPPIFQLSPTHFASTWLLYKDAPKVVPPKIVTSRIEKSLEKELEKEHEQNS